MPWPDGREERAARPGLGGPRRGVTVTGRGRVVGVPGDDPVVAGAAARTAAFADARARAEQYAELAGRSLGEVLDIREDASEVPVQLPGRGEGRQDVEASVTVRWAFAD